MTRSEISVLLRAGTRMLGRAGISQATVARALGLHPSEVSLWLRRIDPPKQLTPRWLRFIRFLAALRDAQAGQDAAQVLAGCDTRRYAPEAWHLDDAGRVRFGPSACEGPVPAAGRRRGGLLLRDGVRLPGGPVDPARVEMAPGAYD